MGKLLIKLFVKNSENTKDPEVRRSYGVLAGVFGIIANLLLSACKLAVGMISKSVSVTADAINNLADAASSVLTLVGFKISGKPADKEHPFGHARLEYVFGLIVSLIVIVLGVETLTGAIEKLTGGGGETEFSLASLIIVGVSILVKIYMAVFVSGIGKRVESEALMATAADSVGDVLATTAILLSMIVAKYTNIVLDGYVGIAVAIYIIVLGAKLVKETADPLLGEAPSHEEVEEIARAALSYEGILGIHDLVIHNYGAGRRFITFHAEVDASADVLESHDLIDRIEEEMAKTFSSETVIHMDPIVTNDAEMNSIRSDMLRVVENASTVFSAPLSMHDFRMVRGVTHTNIIFDVLLPTGADIDEEKLLSYLREEARKIDGKLCVVAKFDRDYTVSRFKNGK